MSILSQANSRGGNFTEYYRRLHSRDDKKTPRIYTKRNAEGLWDSYTWRGWWKKKPFTRDSKTEFEAKERHKRKLKMLEQMRWGNKKTAPVRKR